MHPRRSRGRRAALLALTALPLLGCTGLNPAFVASLGGDPITTAQAGSGHVIILIMNATTDVVTVNLTVVKPNSQTNSWDFSAGPGVAFPVTQLCDVLQIRINSVSTPSSDTTPTDTTQTNGKQISHDQTGQSLAISQTNDGSDTGTDQSNLPTIAGTVLNVVQDFQCGQVIAILVEESAAGISSSLEIY
jgi:hypothetical protein